MAASMEVIKTEDPVEEELIRSGARVTSPDALDTKLKLETEAVPPFPPPNQRRDSNAFSALKDVLMGKVTAWARDITNEVLISSEKKTNISGEATGNSTEEPTFHGRTGQVGSDPTIFGEKSNHAGGISLDEDINSIRTLQKILTEKEHLQKDIESLKQELYSKVDLLQSVTQEKADIEKWLIEAKSELSCKMDFLQSAKQEKAVLENCLIEAKSELSSKVDLLQSANQEKADLEKCLIEAKSELLSNANSLQSATQEKADLEKRLMEATSELSIKANSLQSVTQDRAHIEQHLNEIKSELFSKTNSLQSATQENADLEKRLMETTSELFSKANSLQSATRLNEDLEKRLMETTSELSRKIDLLQSATQEKAHLEKCLNEAKSEVRMKSESCEIMVRENAYLKQRLETVFGDMLKKVEGAQADILDKLRTDLEDSNKDMRIEITQLRQNNEHMQMYISVAKKGVISFSVLHHVAQNITREWYMLGRELDLEDSSLTHIDHDIQGLKDKAFKVLMTWYERAPEATTKDKLVEALRELRRKDIADDIADMA